MPQWKLLDRGSLPRPQPPEYFICELVEGRNPHDVFYDDDRAIAFFPRFPVLYGYALVTPREHRAHVTGDFSIEEYLEVLLRPIHDRRFALRAFPSRKNRS